MRLFNYFEGLDIVDSKLNSFNLEIRGVTSRSKDAGIGYIFVCITGTKEDGHSFACDVRDKGVSLLVVERVTECIVRSGLPYIRVKNTRSALTTLCARHYGNPEKYMKLIAVTGTNGKTSTCKLISEIYRHSGVRVETFGTLEGGLTTPDPEDMFLKMRSAFDRGTEYIVMEASSHALELDKLYGIKFDSAVFTNLTPEHLDFHSDMDKYAEAKSKLFLSAKRSFINIDDTYCNVMINKAGSRVYTYSLLNNKADFFADEYVPLGSRGIKYSLCTPDGNIKLDSKLCGRFNVYNTMSASAVAYADGIESEYIKEAILKTDCVSGRLEKLSLGNVPFTVYIDYAHTPDALEKVMRCIRDFKADNERITVLFGCGGDRDKSKRAVMGRIASSLADFVIVTSDNSRSENTSDIIRDIMKGVDKERPHIVIEDRRSAIEYAVNTASEGDIILLAGKGHEDYEIDIHGKKYFSEKDITVQAVNKRLKGNDY